ncbi:hypothetical protein AwWohl_08780 [Gammaproteobacteria bacterium]|nr:hypothetical protein AwWohl_08780 [Gammaproteobacteria bacterium]
MLKINIEHEIKNALTALNNNGNTKTSLFLKIDISLKAQGLTAILGASGAGKTSLINIISGLIKPDKGLIIFKDRVLFDSSLKINIPIHKRHLGYVFQDARLFPHYRVRGNLKYGLAASMEPKFDEIVKLLGIAHLLARFPYGLSGGEKQRVAIGRALLSAPQLLLMDEPMSSLDNARKQELLPYLKLLTQEIKIPILYVTHNLQEIKNMAQNIITLDQGCVREDSN